MFDHLTRYVASGNLINIPEPQFLHLNNETNSGQPLHTFGTDEMRSHLAVRRSDGCFANRKRDRE